MFSNLKLESRLPTPSGTLGLVGPASLSGNESTTLEILHADATLGALHALAARDSRKYELSFDDSGAHMCPFFLKNRAHYPILFEPHSYKTFCPHVLIKLRAF